MRLDTGSAARCLVFAAIFIAMGVTSILADLWWLAVLNFGFAAGAVLRAPSRKE